MKLPSFSKIFLFELHKLLSSKSIYLIALFFIVILNLFLWVFDSSYSMFEAEYIDFSNIHQVLPWVFLLFIPAISIKAFAEESLQQNLELTLLLPSSAWQIAVSKSRVYTIYFFLVYLLVLIPFSVSQYILSVPLGFMDFGILFTCIVGTFLLIFCMVSISLFFSSLTKNPISAYTFSVVFLILFVGGWDTLASYSLVGGIDYYITRFGFLYYYNDFIKGIFSLHSLLYFLVFSILFISFTQQKLKNIPDYLRINKTKSYKHWIYVGVIIIVLISLTNFLNWRMDFTRDSRYSIKETSKTVLKKIKEPVKLYVLLKGDFPSGFQYLSKEIRFLLDEYKRYVPDLQYTFINPLDTSEVRSLDFNIYSFLNYYKINPYVINIKTENGMDTKNIFPVIIARSQDKLLPIEIMSGGQEVSEYEKINKTVEKLEYNTISTLYHISKTRKEKIGVLQGHNEMDEKNLVSFIRMASKNYDLVELNIKDTLVNDLSVELQALLNFDLLLCVKPQKPFKESEKYLIDQYLMYGGKMIWLIDQNMFSVEDLQSKGQSMALGLNLNLFDLFFKYGLRVNPNMVKDLKAGEIVLSTQKQGNSNNFVPFLWPFYPESQNDSNHILTRNLAPLLFRYSSSIDILDHKPNLKITPILTTSNRAQKVSLPYIIDFSMLKSKINPTLYNFSHIPLGVVLEGVIPSGYKNRVKPISFKNHRDSSIVNKMLVIGDGDLLLNEYHKKVPLPIGYNKWTNKRYENAAFINRSLEFMLQNEDLLQSNSNAFNLYILNKRIIFGFRYSFILGNLLFSMLSLFALYIWFLYYRKKI